MLGTLKRDARPDDRGNFCWAQEQEEHREAGSTMDRRRLVGPKKARVCREDAMAKLALIYGMRLLPVDDLGEVQEANVVLKNGRTARVSMHLIEGSKEEIEKTFRQSIDAFFELYPEI
jgi:hypothetical protein